MFELRGRLGLAKQKVVKIIQGSEKENMGACGSSSSLAPVHQENTLPYVNHAAQVELQKAQALAYYRRMIETPR